MVLKASSGEDLFRICSYDLVIFKFRNKNHFKFSISLYTPLQNCEGSKRQPANMLLSRTLFHKGILKITSDEVQRYFRRLPSCLGEDLRNSLVCRIEAPDLGPPGRGSAAKSQASAGRERPQPAFVYQQGTHLQKRRNYDM